MGSGTDCTIDRFFNGSGTSAVLEHARYPVMIVPPNAQVTHFQKLTFATNLQLNELKVVQALLHFCKQLHAKAELVHITLNGDSLKDNQSAFLEELSKMKSPLISYKEIRGKEVVNRLNRVVKQTGADILVLAHHHRGFLSRIFGHSITSEVAVNQKIPLLVFPAAN